MPQEVSKQVAPASAADPEITPDAAAESHDEDEDQPEASSSSTSKKKKKKSKKGKEKAELAGEKVDQKVVDSLLNNNPSLAGEIAGMDPKKIGEMLKHMKLEDLITGMAPGGKNKTEMGSFKFWNTQPVPKFDEKPAPTKPDGPLKPADPESVPKEGAALIDGFEWCTMDLEDEAQMKEVYELLCGHYVEDNEAMFRFNYSVSFLNWALKAPGWTSKWHVGVRVTNSKKLVAFISGIPVKLQVREKLVDCSEINFLCIHKKLRSKRLAPVLITEITRRCNQDGIWQAIYTAGVLLPKPISTCRYYHRSLDWLKLHEVGFSPLPPNSTKARQVTKYQLPSTTSIPGLREAKKEDLDAVLDLNDRYLQRYDIYPKYSKEEMEHWFLDHTSDPKDRVIWTYVVEDPKTKKITDFFSFYNLESSVIGNAKHSVIRAAYMFYYATEAAFQTKDDGKKEDRKALKNRLNELVKDALILAKQYKFDVFNALTLLDNTLFLEQQKFGAGDGQLHYYLFNWRTPQIRGGVTGRNELDEKEGSGVGMVML